MSVPTTVLIHVEPHLLATSLLHVLAVLGHSVTVIQPGANVTPSRFDVAVATTPLPPGIEAATVVELTDGNGLSVLTSEDGDRTWEQVSGPTDLAWLLDRIEHGAA